MILLIAFFAALFITYFLGFYVIPMLKKLSFGQVINKEGPVWHNKKSGTPTMGGIMFVCGTVCAALIAYILLALRGKELGGSENFRSFVSCLALAIEFAMIGFIDDYIKVVKKQNLGLRARVKFGLQAVVAGIYMLQMALLKGHDGMLYIPFWGQVDFGWSIYLVHMFIILGCVNAVNITDGVDGLASSVTTITAIGLLFLALMFGNNSAAILSICLAGGCIGFLIWNFYPAQIMMGDTGSLFLGGLLVSISFLLKVPVLLAFFGIVYVIETLSVMVQMTYYHFTHKRIFKMSPIHHHFELSGYSETKINLLFMLFQAIGCVVGIIAEKNQYIF
ncbi:MAG: phospho-N-acetylmuramoyl-pentapeptide-transferase [Oscillospiraceae bacterium]|jgi:phospho-N-acetylmuramoyl-pentapeptide-transferase|nr:phospho-N-acetylmuramoyl-pentapeptide-transferase [Oscillospiraceae bacterium]